MIGTWKGNCCSALQVKNHEVHFVFSQKLLKVYICLRNLLFCRVSRWILSLCISLYLFVFCILRIIPNERCVGRLKARMCMSTSSNGICNSSIRYNRAIAFGVIDFQALKMEVGGFMRNMIKLHT